MEDRCSLLITVAVVTLLLCQLDRVSCIFVTEWPISVSTFENDTAEFFCEVHDKDDSMHLVWFTDMQLDDNQITLDFANDTVPLYHGNNGGEHSIEYEETSAGVHRLVYRITNVKVADEGLYACGFVPLPLPLAVSGENLLGEVATLNVLRPPLNSHPQCEVAGVDLTPFTNSSAIGLPLDFHCEIQGGRPTPDLTWYRNDNSVASGSDVTLLSHTLSADDNGVEFTCTASGNSLVKNTSCTITPLRIPPTASITSSVTYVTTGANGTFTCVGDGLPYISEIEWLVNGKSAEELNDLDFEINDERNDTKSSSELYIFNANFKRKHNEIQCIVKIPSGLQTTASVTIDNRNNNERSLIMMYLLPIIAATSGLLIVILIIFIAICFCKQSKRGDLEEDVYQGGDIEANENAYQEGISNDIIYDNGYHYQGTPGDGYVLNQLPGGPSQQGATMSSEHPYADINI